MTPTLNQMTTNVASFAQSVTTSALSAGIHDATREQKIADLTKLFAAWPKLCRAMARLEEVAPNAARAGREMDDRLTDHIETKAA